MENAEYIRLDYKSMRLDILLNLDLSQIKSKDYRYLLIGSARQFNENINSSKKCLIWQIIC